MKRLGYARVSTSEQEEALEAQEARLRAAGCEVICSDVESGREDDRDGLLEAMALIKRGGWDQLVITRTDRLGRHAAYADALIGICEANGVTISSLDGGTIETASPTGFFMARIQTSLAEMESRMLSMRIKRNYEVYREQGRHLRRRMPFGYCGGADHKLAAHPENWDQALRVIEMLREIGTFSGVANALSQEGWCNWKPAGTNLLSWFANPVIRGHLCYGMVKSRGKGWGQQWEKILYDQHPALICEGEWHELAKRLRQARNPFQGNQLPRHGLTGLLRCANCGFTLRYSNVDDVAWWRCRHRSCQQRARIQENEALEVVIRACMAESNRLVELAAEPPSIDPKLVPMYEDLENLRRMARRTPSLESAVRSLENEIESLKRREFRAQPTEALLELREAMRDPRFFSVSASPTQQRTLFRAVLDRVVVNEHRRIVGIVPCVV